MTTPRAAKHKSPVLTTAFMLVGGPKNMPLMLEQSGVRYATIFMSEKSLKRFQAECCSLNSFEPTKLESSAEILYELQRAQKFGCGLLLVDPLGPEINKQKAQPIAAFVRSLS
jgi:hypothetical protein